jgi:hypothetical protein
LYKNLRSNSMQWNGIYKYVLELSEDCKI